MAAVDAVQAQEAMCQDAALQESVELVLHELRRVGTGSVFGLGEEGRSVLLHQNVAGIVALMGRLSWSSNFGHTGRLFDCRLMLEGIGWQVAQFGVQAHVVVEVDDVVGDVAGGLDMVGVVALPDAFHRQV